MAPALFIASKAMPADIAPSPITATTLFVPPLRSRAVAMPSAAEIEVDEWAAPNGSYGLSSRRVKPERPPPWRSVRIRSRRPGENFMGIGLMADVPNQTVARCVEHVVQGDGQFDHAEPGAKVSTGGRNGGDGLSAQFVGDAFEVALGKAAKLFGGDDLVEQLCRGNAHGTLFSTVALPCKWNGFKFGQKPTPNPAKPRRIREILSHHTGARCPRPSYARHRQ